MCSECKSLTLATDPDDDSNLEVWLPHNDEDLAAGHIWVSVTEDPLGGTNPYQASVMLGIEDQDRLIGWIKERRLERAGEEL